MESMEERIAKLEQVVQRVAALEMEIMHLKLLINLLRNKKVDVSKFPV